MNEAMKDQHYALRAKRYLSAVVPQGGTQEDAFLTDTRHGHGHVFVLDFMIRDGLFCFSPWDLRFTPCDRELTLCALRDVGGWLQNN